MKNYYLYYVFGYQNNHEVVRVIDKKHQEKIDIQLLLTGIAEHYGYDFRDYASASLKRRLQQNLISSKCKNYVELLKLVLRDKRAFQYLLRDLSVTVTDMFRDPEIYRSIRKHVIPILRTFPFIKIWHAGCATGEEVYSMAVLLYEEGLLDRTQIYATDFNISALEVGKEGIYPTQLMKQYSQNYRLAGGERSFSDYYYAKYGSAKMADFLREKMTFSFHNLSVDHSFCEVQMIICRNVIIYFNRKLQERVLKLFDDSLSYGGFLLLGSKETLSFSSLKDQYKNVLSTEKLYEKTYPIEEGKEHG